MWLVTFYSLAILISIGHCAKTKKIYPPSLDLKAVETLKKAGGNINAAQVYILPQNKNITSFLKLICFLKFLSVNFISRKSTTIDGDRLRVIRFYPRTQKETRQ